MSILVIGQLLFLTMAVATEKPLLVNCSRVVYYLVLNCDESKSIKREPEENKKIQL